MVSSRVIYSLLFYVLVVLLVVVAKPNLMFSADGNVRPFGVGSEENKTVFSLGVAVVCMAIVSFYIFALIDLVFGSKSQ